MHFSAQIALDVIEELCYEMDLHRLEAMDEYAVFVVTNRGERTCNLALPICYGSCQVNPPAIQHGVPCLHPSAGQNVRPLTKKEYILDVATEAEPIDSSYSFWFRRVIWCHPMKFDNELCVTMHYNQVTVTAVRPSVGTGEVEIYISRLRLS